MYMYEIIFDEMMINDRENMFSEKREKVYIYIHTPILFQGIYFVPQNIISRDLDNFDVFQKKLK